MFEKANMATPRDTAHAFRGILSAMSRPGTIVPFLQPFVLPLPFFPGTAAVAITLCDYLTPIWLAQELDQSELRKSLQFHTGAPLAKQPGDAAFVFLDALAGRIALQSCSRGTHEYPDRSATAVIQVPTLSTSGPVEFSGPGLKSPVRLHAEGLGADFWRSVMENNAGYPIGVDLIFVSPHAIAACPRSVRVRFVENA
jgi:alpha-D-ribose 1-methylphosphonate 5-triphosphate synthase subunit PhnH